MELTLIDSIGKNVEIFNLKQTNGLNIVSKNIETNIFPVSIKIDSKHTNPTKVTINSRERVLEENKSVHIFKCSLNENAQVNIRIETGEVLYNLNIKRKEINNVGIENISSLINFQSSLQEALNEKMISFNDIIDKIKLGIIPILHIENPQVVLDNEDLRTYILESMPFLLNICSNPRMHLKTENELQDVSRVKRINSYALRHLASHSEHWMSKTFTSLKPSRLIAEVQEDDIDLYENRVVKTLIKRIEKYVNLNRKKLEERLEQSSSIIDWSEYSNITYDSLWRSEFISDIVAGFNPSKELDNQNIYKLILKQLNDIDSKIKLIYSTNFYSKLKRNKDVRSPLTPTNIFKMDPNYNRTYNLWNKIDKTLIEEKEKDLWGTINCDLETCYLNYCQILCLYALNLLSYECSDDIIGEITSNGKIVLNANFKTSHFDIKINTLENEFEYSKIEFRLVERLNKKLPLQINEYDFYDLEIDECIQNKCYIKNNQLIVDQKLKPDELKLLVNIYKLKYTKELKNKEQYYQRKDKLWRSYITNFNQQINEHKIYTINIYSIFSEISKSQTDIEKDIDYILNNLVNESEIESTYLFNPTKLCNLENDVSLQSIESILNYGDSYSSKSGCNNYKIGILPISQSDLYSIQRIMKLINSNIIRRCIELNKSIDFCPVCKESNIKVENGISKCYNCETIFGMTKCNDSNCNHNFAWVKSPMKYLDTNEYNNLDKLLKKEQMLGINSITNFEIISREKIIPICPKCGGTLKLENNLELETAQELLQY